MSSAYETGYAQGYANPNTGVRKSYGNPTNAAEYSRGIAAGAAARRATVTELRSGKIVPKGGKSHRKSKSRKSRATRRSRNRQ